MDWAEGLLAARTAGDPQARWLLSSRRIVVLPWANPNGLGNALAAIESAPSAPPAHIDQYHKAFPDLKTPGSKLPATTPFGEYMHQRKNQRGPGYGTDLNRNHRSNWTASSVQEPWMRNYEGWPGASPSSEPETRIMDAVIARVRPNALVDVHQFGNFISIVPGPEVSKSAAMRAAARLGTANGFRVPPLQEVTRPDDYPEGGMLAAHAAATGSQLGITLELGTSFVTTNGGYRAVQRDAADVLTRLARTSYAPATELQGPDASSQPQRTRAGWNIGVSDERTGSHHITRAELVTDPLAAPGNGFELQSADSVFDGSFETLRVPREHVPQGLVGVRAMDARGNWGPVTALELRD
jgi:hypothetical protein